MTQNSFIYEDQNSFIYADEENENVTRAAAVHVAVPANIQSAEELISFLQRQLIFPDYFGGNWNSFQECVRELTWLPPGLVVISHADVPLLNFVRDAKIYLSIMSRAVCTLSKSRDHQLSVIFPIKFRDQVEWLLRSRRAEEARRSI